MPDLITFYAQDLLKAFFVKCGVFTSPFIDSRSADLGDGSEVIVNFLYLLSFKIFTEVPIDTLLNSCVFFCLTHDLV